MTTPARMIRRLPAPDGFPRQLGPEPGQTGLGRRLPGTGRVRTCRLPTLPGTPARVGFASGSARSRRPCVWAALQSLPCESDSLTEGNGPPVHEWRGYLVKGCLTVSEIGSWAREPECPAARVRADVVLDMDDILSTRVGVHHLQTERLAEREIDASQRADLHSRRTGMHAVSPSARQRRRRLGQPRPPLQSVVWMPLPETAPE